MAREFILTSRQIYFDAHFDASLGSWWMILQYQCVELKRCTVHFEQKKIISNFIPFIFRLGYNFCISKYLINIKLMLSWTWILTFKITFEPNTRSFAQSKGLSAEVILEQRMLSWLGQLDPEEYFVFHPEIYLQQRI